MRCFPFLKTFLRRYSQVTRGEAGRPRSLAPVWTSGGDTAPRFPVEVCGYVGVVLVALVLCLDHSRIFQHTVRPVYREP